MSPEDLSAVLDPPKRRTLSDEVVLRLRQAILDGHIAPGEQLRETRLADYMRVSRGPIREALRKLEQEGLVIVRPNGRAYVARLSPEDLREVYTLRAALERLAVQWACVNATPEDLDEMQAVVDTMAEYIERGISEKEAAELDLRFHDIIYRAARHQRLYQHWSRLRPQIHVFLLSRNVANPDFRAHAVHGHQDVLNAIRSGDEAKAMAVIETHLKYGYDTVRTAYERSFAAHERASAAE